MMKFYNENSSEINEKAFDLGLEVARIIHQIGVPAHIKGYQYLRMAIMLVVEDCDRVNSLSKHIYPDVAEKYQTTTSRVEGAIRKAIDIAWDRGDVDIINSYFECTIAINRGRPTPTEFIAMIADDLRLKYGKFN
jgi:two-component system response regulator (stage 0 sporulation protein A)